MRDMIKTLGWCRQDTNPAHDIAALQNEQVVYVLNENYRNPLMEAKHQLDLLKDYFNHVGALAGQDLRCVSKQPWGQKKLASVLFLTTQLFQEILFKLMLFKIQTNFQTKSNLFSTSFQIILNAKSQVPCLKTSTKNIPHYKSQFKNL